MLENMLKKLASTLALSLLFSATASALPIVEADAFTAGDNKAVLETGTGLIWMDFGINSHQSFDHVRYLLSTDYAGWRLPSAAEVDRLWTSLFSNLPEWNRFNQGFGSLTSLSQDDYFNSIFAIFGQSPDASYSSVENGVVVDSWTTKNLFGVFMKDGISGFVSMDSPYDSHRYSTAMYFESGQDFSGWFGTLLVKDSNIQVPEPSGALLALAGLLALLSRRQLRR